MGDNLREMSNPYGYEYITAGRGHVLMSRTLPPVDIREVKPLYSQEYVSLLLQKIAELEDKEKARTKLIEDTWNNIPAWQPLKHTGRLG